LVPSLLLSFMLSMAMTLSSPAYTTEGLDGAGVLSNGELVDEILDDVRTRAETSAGLDAPVFYARELAATDPDEWGLTDEEVALLRIAQSAAWLAIDDAEAAAAALQPLGPPEQWQAAWANQAALQVAALVDTDLVPAVIVTSVQNGVWPPAVQVAISGAVARHALRQQAYDEATDATVQGVTALAGVEPRWRTPLYALWLLAQEKLGRDQGAIQRDLAAFDDPATAQLADSLSGSSILGQPFPDLPLFHLSEQGHQETTVAAELHGRLSIVVVGALWHAQSVLYGVAVSEALQDLQVQQNAKHEWSFVFLAMDQKDTLGAGAFGAAAEMGRIVGDLRGWDSEFDEALQVGVLPGWVLVDQAGIIRSGAPANPQNPVQDLPQVLQAIADFEAKERVE
jgi:hypothetical protein